jgi:S1-C subfamily serine protease
MRYVFLILIVLLLSANAQADLGEIVGTVTPSVFLVRTYDPDGKPLNLGTGFVAGDTGYVVTNWHVMKNASSAVADRNGKDYRVLRIVAIDVDNDLALLQVNERIDGIPLRDELPYVGESVIVVGNPLGYANTASTGIVSAIRTTGNRTTIQITAPISPGSSGSPVLDLHGEVVGVANSTATRGQNINFVIPSRMVTEMMRRAGTGGVSGSVRTYTGEALKSLAVYLTNSTIEDLWDAENEGLIARGNKTAFMQYNSEQINEYTGTVSGQVMDVTGDSARSIVRIDGITERTDAQGSFLISGLFPGDYHIRVERNGASAEEEISIAPGENRHILPVIPTTVETDSSENVSYFLLKNVPPGRYTLFARGELENGTMLTGQISNISVYSETENVDITLYRTKPSCMEISFEEKDKVIVTLLDKHQQPVGNGHEIQLFTTHGAITPDRTLTDKEGRAFAVISDADGATVTAVYRDPETWNIIYDIKVRYIGGERS